MTELRLVGDTSAFTLRRTLRDIRYIGFIVILPIIFYVMFTAIFAKNAAVNDLAWSKYSLISMLSFGIVGNAINLLGTRIANERQDKWMDFIKVSPISSLYYNVSFVITFLVISLLTMFLLFVTAFFLARRYIFDYGLSRDCDFITFREHSIFTFWCNSWLSWKCGSTSGDHVVFSPFFSRRIMDACCCYA